MSKLSALGLAGRRQAHAPTIVPEVVVSIPRPRVPEEFGTKVPTNVRQVYLNKIIDECVKIYPTEQDAYDRVSLEKVNECANVCTCYGYIDCWGFVILGPGVFRREICFVLHNISCVMT